jgi:ABC-type phosphate transport system substrate-binding protein
LLKHKLRKIAVAGGVIAGILVGVVPAASAGDTVNAVGSDTSYWIMNYMSQMYNTSGSVLNPDGTLLVNTPPQNIPPFPAGSIAPADGKAGQVVYGAGFVTPPNGSSAGVTALRTDTTGAVDIARSSRNFDASRGDTSDLEFYAYALGAVDWVKFPGGYTGSLTHADLINIYTCDAVTGLPIYSNWNQVPGSNKTGAIVKYAPQTAAGTYAYMVSSLLNGNAVDKNCNAANKSTFLQEHDATGVVAATKANAIYVYDYGQWVTQSKKISPDLRNGATWGKFEGMTPSATNVKEDAGRFPGTRYIFNVLKNNSLGNGSPSYGAAKKFAGSGPGAGVTGGNANGYVCANRMGTALNAYGFRALKAKVDPNTGLSSYCRKNPTSL